MGTRVPRDPRIRSSIALCMTLTPSMSDAVTADSLDNDDDSNAVDHAHIKEESWQLLLKQRTRFPESVIQGEKRVCFVVVNSLDIAEKPDSMPMDDAK